MMVATKGSVLAEKAVEAQGRGSVLPEVHVPQQPTPCKHKAKAVSQPRRQWETYGAKPRKAVEVQGKDSVSAVSLSHGSWSRWPCQDRTGGCTANLTLASHLNKICLGPSLIAAAVDKK